MNTQKQVIKIYAATEYDKWTVTRTGFRFDLDRERSASPSVSHCSPLITSCAPTF